MQRVIGERSLDETGFSGPDAGEMYANMVRARRFDERALALQERGWLRGYDSARGLEATGAGAAFALSDADVLFPTARSNALRIARDVPLSALLLRYRGRPDGRSGGERSVFAPAVRAATQLPVAVGAAMATGYRDGGGVVLARLDADATYQGDFHEAANFAGVFDAPVVFLCANDGRGGWSEDARRSRAPTVADGADAYGFEGVRVDGDDPLAVASVVDAALADARAGDPVLVEAVTPRGVPPGTGEDFDAERSDPLARCEAFLREAGVVDDEFLTQVREAAEAELDRAVDAAESDAPPSPAELFAHVYADVPERLRAQRDGLRSIASGGGAADPDA